MSIATEETDGFIRYVRSLKKYNYEYEVVEAIMCNLFKWHKYFISVLFKKGLRLRSKMDRRRCQIAHGWRTKSKHPKKRTRKVQR